ncbi:hypothetical protein PIB30_087051 [Stylosanthes scabra]|uniref:Uncharacterized protein n=1 Tax=Stylosanthes scabra TaxID=79078 RepID=A0ABU6ZS12_9FABA|nr:hypothetical protein [Stylosanthes scabra]
MAIAIHTFDGVSSSKSDLLFCVYVICLWEAPSKYNAKEIQSIEMVVKDCKRIHVSIPKRLITRWRVHLQEFKMFMITNLIVIDLKMKPKLRTIPCTWNRRIHCILFGNKVDQIVPYLEKPQDELLIVVLQYFKSNFELSKVHFNIDFKDIVEFRDGLVNVGPTMSGRISEVHFEGAFAGAEELIKGRATEGQPWIVVKIVALNVGSSDWCYSACVGCEKKVEVIANDNTGYINMLLWDREAKILCGKPTDKVKTEKVEGDDDYPPNLNKMLDRKLLLKIHVRNSSIHNADHVYPVIKVIDDEEVIDKCTPVKVPVVQGSIDEICR